MQSYVEERFPGIRSKDGRLMPFSALLVALYLTVASAYIPTALLSDILSTYPYMELLLSVAVPLAGIGTCIFLTVSPKPIIPFCILSALIILFGINIKLSSTLCVFFTLLALYAYLLREKLFILVAATNVVSFAALFFLHNSVSISVFSLAFIPTAITLFWVFRQKEHRVSSVVSLSVSMALTLVVMILALILFKDGELSLATIKNFFDSLKAQLSAIIAEALVISSESLSTTISQNDAAALANALITKSFNLLPATLAIILFVISFIIHSLYISLVSLVVKDKGDIEKSLVFKMSVTSAIIFMSSYFLALMLYADKMYLYAIAAQNIYTMLFPGFTLITFGFFGGLIKSGKASCLSTLLYFGLFALLFFVTDIVLVLASFAGAIIVIISAIKSKKKNN